MYSIIRVNKCNVFLLLTLTRYLQAVPEVRSTSPLTGENAARGVAHQLAPRAAASWPVHRQAPQPAFWRTETHLKGKLQTAGYRQAVEKWDSDSDSDESSKDDLAV